MNQDYLVDLLYGITTEDGLKDIQYILDRGFKITPTVATELAKRRDRFFTHLFILCLALPHSDLLHHARAALEYAVRFRTHYGSHGYAYSEEFVTSVQREFPEITNTELREAFEWAICTSSQSDLEQQGACMGVQAWRWIIKIFGKDHEITKLVFDAAFSRMAVRWSRHLNSWEESTEGLNLVTLKG
ncbi:hypothetical protein HDV00_008892 [Rhizophlyctis rosea]|nr:hypothetical protein HDV00_008892 [Rhizophlyctis rosea]